MAKRQRNGSLRPRRTGWLWLPAALLLALAVAAAGGAAQRRSAQRLVPLSTISPAPVETALPSPAEPAVTQAASAQPSPAAPTAEPAPTAAYVLNTNTRKFHRPDCASVQDMKPKNRQDFSGTRDEAMAQGYVPCKRCNP